MQPPDPFMLFGGRAIIKFLASNKNLSISALLSLLVDLFSVLCYQYISEKICLCRMLLMPFTVPYMKQYCGLSDKRRYKILQRLCLIRYTRKDEQEDHCTKSDPKSLLLYCRKERKGRQRISPFGGVWNRTWKMPKKCCFGLFRLKICFEGYLRSLPFSMMDTEQYSLLQLLWSFWRARIWCWLQEWEIAFYQPAAQCK